MIKDNTYIMLDDAIYIPPDDFDRMDLIVDVYNLPDRARCSTRLRIVIDSIYSVIGWVDLVPQAFREEWGMSMEEYYKEN